jgi:hypothetical protein
MLHKRLLIHILNNILKFCTFSFEYLKIDSSLVIVFRIFFNFRTFSIFLVFCNFCDLHVTWRDGCWKPYLFVHTLHIFHDMFSIIWVVNCNGHLDRSKWWWHVPNRIIWQMPCPKKKEWWPNRESTICITCFPPNRYIFFLIQ